MRRRSFLGAAAGLYPLLRQQNAMAQYAPPSTSDPGSTIDILRPVGQKFASPVNVGGRSQLFVDNALVRSAERVWITPRQAEKLPEPVMKPNRPWEGWRLCLFGNVIYDRDEKIYKMWYLGETGRMARQAYFPQTEYNQTLYATSADGIHWDKPLVGTIPAAIGDKFGHNCVALVEQPNVFKDYNDPDPARRYKMLTFIGDPREGRGYYTMVSRDGLAWQPYSPSAIAPSRDNINGFYDHRRGLYIAFPKISTVIRGHARRVYYVMASKNFIQWSQPVMAFYPDLRDDVSSLGRLEAFREILDIGINPEQIRTEFYGLGFHQAESCTLAFPWVITINDNDKFGNQDGISEIQLAVSRDLVGWERPFRLPCIQQGKPGEWDSGFITVANETLPVGDEVWLYYAGSNYSHGCPCFYDTENSGQGTKYSASIGLAKWKRDRFASVNGAADGKLTTIPIVYEGQRLEVNVNVPRGGKLTARILDAGGRPMEGAAVSDPIQGDNLRHTVTWKGDANVSAFRDKPVTLQFEITQAELFSFAFRD